METKNNEETIKDLQDKLKDVEKERLKLIKDFKDIQMGIRPLLENEKKRLIKKYGMAHPRTQRIEAKVVHNINMVRHFDVELQIAEIKEPEVKKNEMLIHGRITSKQLLGIKNLSVYLTDRRGKKLTHLGSPETDPSGYYSFLIYPEEIEKIKNIEIFLTVCDEKGKTLYQHPESLKISEPGKKYVDMILDKEILKPVKTAREPGPPPATWEVKGKITDENDNSIKDLTVSLYDKENRFDNILGTTVTGEDGTFIFTYPTGKLQDLIKANPDIYLKVLVKKGKPIYSSEKAVKCEPGRIEVFNIKIEGTGKTKREFPIPPDLKDK
jgi:hypothetical protein